MPEVYDRQDVDLTILLPSYNEQEAILPVITEVRQALADWEGDWEILVVDDASADQTAIRAAQQGVRVIRRPENGGSGASRKTGTRAARGRLVAMLDADGTYVPSYLPKILSYFPEYDQVNGARTSEQGTLKALRFSAKLLIRKLAEWISGKRIPDLNTGMKVYKRDLMLRYLWCMPDGFSCVTSMTLAFLCNGHPVKYVDVDYRKRIGHSKFHPVKDAAKYASTVMRIIMYFRPLRVFFPMSLILVGVALLISLARSIRWGYPRVDDAEVMLGVAALMVLVIGLLADLIVAQRRDIGESVTADTTLDQLIRLGGRTDSESLATATYQPVASGSSGSNGEGRGSAPDGPSTAPVRHAPPPAPVPSPAH
ncbi:MAG TPA: glycosyltransferase family 2 protein [Tepidisphaeraceae bacterium]|nr:glycosyltransferase family 2 protein [Tepidisphaeraceae bacterium]